MTLDDWLKVAGVMVTILGGAYTWLRKDLSNLLDTRLSQFREELNSEKIQSQQKEIDLLRERVNQTK